MSSWNNMYAWSGDDDLTTRLRRLERGQQTVRRGSVLTASGKYSGVPVGLLDKGRIDMTSSLLTTKGSIPPSSMQGNFGFTATTTSITIYWDGTNGSALLSLIRANGEVVHIPGGSLTISSLSSNTSYGFLPYYSSFNNCGIGWVVGSSGAPQFAFTTAAQTALAYSQQVMQGREALSLGYITYSTTASGTTVGSGGGGSGGCVMLGTDIIALGEEEYSTEHLRENQWWRLQCEDFPHTLNCTHDHPLYHAVKGKRRADSFKKSDLIITELGEKRIITSEPFVRVCTKVKVKMPRGHLFWANGYLSHNVKGKYLP